MDTTCGNEKNIFKTFLKPHALAGCFYVQPQVVKRCIRL